MPTIPCPDYLRDCECENFPVRNFSQESPDVPVFQCTVHQPATAGTFFASDCLGFCESTVSEDDCLECAQRESITCPPEPPVVPPGLPPNNPPPTVFRRPIYTNSQQNCVVACPDGTTFEWTIAPGTVSSFWQGDANARAHALACKRATERRVCFTNAASLANGCVSSFYSLAVGAQGGTSPYTFALTDGALPDGLSLHPVGLITGTPTTSGTAAFSITVTDALGSTQTKAFTLRVIEITSPATLPNAIQNSAYSQTLTSVGNTFPVSWAITGGALPTGLSMPASGVISGTPTVLGANSFTATITDATGASCSKDFTLEVESVAPLEYWKLDEVAGTRAGSINGIGLTPFGAAASTTGIIGNAWQWTSPVVTLESGDVVGLRRTGSMSVTGWYRRDGSSGGAQTVFQWFHKDGGGASVRNLVMFTNLTQFVVDVPGASLTLTVPFVVTNGVWYFFHAYYDVSTGKLGLEIDNVPQGTSVASAVLSPSVTGGFALLSLSAVGDDFRVDEVAVRDYLPSASELAAFYNGGAGHSWPL